MRHALAVQASVLVLFAASMARAQDSAAAAPKGISDNSFLVEEAYNQEAGVVQHIANFRRSRAGDWSFTFTQEWPAPGQRHQLSYTVPLLGGAGAGTGAGDVILNYRYQAVGHDDDAVWVAPRLSVILPTGDVAHDRGAGGPGVQVNLPVSVQLNEALVTHWNAGATITHARAASGARATTRGYNAAASAIWLLAPTLNLMLESTWERDESVDDAGARQSEQRVTLLPGVRGAFNFASGMQVVPGIGIPIGLQHGGGRDLFLYLSVEHAFR